MPVLGVTIRRFEPKHWGMTPRSDLTECIYQSGLESCFAGRPSMALFGAWVRVSDWGVHTKALGDSLPPYLTKCMHQLVLESQFPPQNRQLVRPSKALFGAWLRVYNTGVRTRALGDAPPL